MPIHKSFALLPLFALLPAAAGASCGTNFCPRAHETHAEARSSWQARWTVERDGYDLAGSSGAYTLGMLDLRYLRGDRWIAALHLPYVSLNAPGGDRRGFGNPMALAEYRWHPAPGRALGAGAQLEVPWGDDEDGLAQPHYMAVPYASASARWGAFFLGGNAGVSLAFGGHSHESGSMAGMDHSAGAMETASPIHPHEDREAIYRLSAGLDLPAWRVRPEAFLNGQHVLTEERELGSADDYLSVGLAVPVSFGRVEIVPEGEAPITSERRFEWALGLSCGVRF